MSVELAARVNGLEVLELHFPACYDQPPFDPERPYLAVVLEGGLVKSFPRRTLDLKTGSAVAMPIGERHSARFSSTGARILVVACVTLADCAGALSRLRPIDGVAPLAWRLAAELRARDSAAPLALEGLALELISVAARQAAQHESRPPAWLARADELLSARAFEPLRLAAIADEIGVHPGHLARVFRAHRGLSPGEYVRRLRLAWAAERLADESASLSAIAAHAGFADQSHFTRAFRRQTGLTPGRFRASLGETAGGRRAVVPPARDDVEERMEPRGLNPVSSR